MCARGRGRGDEQGDENEATTTRDARRWRGVVSGLSPPSRATREDKTTSAWKSIHPREDRRGVCVNLGTRRRAHARAAARLAAHRRSLPPRRSTRRALTPLLASRAPLYPPRRSALPRAFVQVPSPASRRDRPLRSAARTGPAPEALPAWASAAAAAFGRQGGGARESNGGSNRRESGRAAFTIGASGETRRESRR